MPFFWWNDARLARTVGLLHNYQLYYTRDATAPIIGTLHNPISQLLYLVIAWLDEPTVALLAGSCLSCLFVFGPLAWLHLSGRERNLTALLRPCYALLAAGLVIQQNAGMRYSTFNIHTDAAALGFATVAAGILYRSAGTHSYRPLVLSALFAALSVWSKQTMGLLLVALLAFVWFADGFARARRYAICLAIAGAAVSTIVFAIFWPPEAMIFNVLTLAGDRPLKSAAGNNSVLAWFQILKSDSLLASIPALFFVLNLASNPIARWRELVRKNRWVLFTLIGLVMLPVSIVASRTVGGDVNHLSLVSYFLLVSATLAATNAARTFIVILIVLNLDPSAAATAVRAYRGLRANPSEAAYRYNLQHPGKAYFPWNPLAALLTEGELYHFDYAIFDREVRGYALTRAQLFSSLPPNPEFIAIPPGERLRSAAILNLISGKPKVAEPGLENWTVYKLSP
jgi:hypothetical protein